MLRRKHVGNPVDYFDKNFADYKAGFQSKGKYSIKCQLFAILKYETSISRRKFDNYLFQVSCGSALKSCKNLFKKKNICRNSALQCLVPKLWGIRFGDNMECSRWVVDRPWKASPAHLWGQLQPSNHPDRLWQQDLCGRLQPVSGFKISLWSLRI